MQKLHFYIHWPNAEAVRLARSRIIFKENQHPKRPRHWCHHVNMKLKHYVFDHRKASIKRIRDEYDKVAATIHTRKV